MTILFPFFLFVLSILVYVLSVRGIAENSLMHHNRLGLLVHEKFINSLFPSNFRNVRDLRIVYLLSTLTYVGIMLFILQLYEQGIHSYVYAFLFCVLVSSAVSDLYTQMVSDEILNLGYALIPLSLLLGVENFLQQLVFVAVAFVVMRVLNWLGLLGGGDVQLLVILGFFLTKAQFLTSVLLAAVAGVIFAILFWLVRRSLGRFAFLPSILAGVTVTLLFNINLFSYYFD